VSAPHDIKSCCAAAYSSDATALLLGESSYHPGGAALTRRLASLLGLTPGQRVADIASGPGATARLLAAEYGVTVDGIDIAAPVVRRAQESAAGTGFGGAIRFHLGDSEALPFPDSTFDAVVTECAYCTFPDKAVAAAEFARVLRPGGRLGLADVTVAEAGLPDELTTVAAWAACIADARPSTEYIRILTNAGLHITHSEAHDHALARMIDQIEARLQLARMAFPQALSDAGVDSDAVLRFIDLARQAVTGGLAGYSLIVAAVR
jgi:ubiquinone/menaquinone biosynthesis C-methylase UbiE